MKTIELGKPKPCDELLGTVPLSAQFSKVIEPPAKLYAEGRCIGIYDTLPSWLGQKGHAIAQKVKPKKQTRTQGLPTKSSVLGALPRLALRNYYCRFSADTSENPELWNLAKEFALHVCKIYEEHLPEEYERHLAQTKETIVPDWVVPGTPFTTINFNVNHAIRHHRDAANQKGVWSNVIILRKKARGGLLVLPEYGVALTQSDGALIIFDGQKVMHGVTPIQMEATGYRCSVVLYALDQFKNCYPYAQELEHIKNHRTKVEATFRSEQVKKYMENGRNANKDVSKRKRKI